MAKKSRIRRIGKKIFLILQLLLTFLFLYPLFIKPLPFIWINGFLGLLAPYIVIAQLLLFIFWLLAKPWLSLIPLLTLVIGWETLFSLVAWHPGMNMAQKKKDNICRVISWNVKGFNGNQATSTLKLRTQDIAYSIQKWNPDIICMQEYNTNDRPNDIANHATYFNKNYPYNYFSKDIQIADKSYFLGCIIFSKYPIIKAQRIAYTNQESLIYVDLLRGDDTIRVFTTHLASYRFKQNDFIALEATAQANSIDISGKKGVLRKMRTAFVERAVQAQIVKKYLGIVGFLLAMVGMIFTATYKWNGTDIEPLGEISFLFWITTWNISGEINKQKPNMWWVYTVSIISLAVICALIFVYIYKS